MKAMSTTISSQQPVLFHDFPYAANEQYAITQKYIEDYKSVFANAKTELNNQGVDKICLSHLESITFFHRPSSRAWAHFPPPPESSTSCFFFFSPAFFLYIRQAQQCFENAQMTEKTITAFFHLIRQQEELCQNIYSCRMGIQKP
ncbi:MAG: hypothetical protein FJZ58_04080 [Chlamydiae bacterium]|nr:hypothetical protein [Chlamydiota bacterium]